MMLDKIDFAWSFVLMILALTGVWKVYEHRRQYWKTWPWHAALCIGWMVSVPLNFATGDTVFAWIGIGLSIAEGYNWITHQNQAKSELAKSVALAEARREVYEAFRIDDLPKN